MPDPGQTAGLEEPKAISPGLETPAGKAEGQAPPVEGSGGPKPEELATHLEEVKRTLNELKERLARTEHTAAYYRTLAEGGVPQETSPVAEDEPSIEIPPDEEFYASPGQYIAKVTLAALDAKLAEQRREDENRRMTEAEQTARKNFNEGLSRAVKDSPDLFSGIEQQVATAVLEAYRAKTLQADALGNPDVWKAFAGAYRLTQGEWDLSKYVKPSIQATQMTAGERPGPKAPSQPQATLSDEERWILRKARVPEEAYLKAKAEEERGK
jgi:hypothetical protein